jgi:hypothetical protein
MARTVGSEKTRELQRTLYRAAKANPQRRFHALYDKVLRRDVLERAWEDARRNRAAAGIDRQTIADVEGYGIANLLGDLQRDLKDGSYRVLPARRVFIPKPGRLDEQRPLSIPAVRDRIVQAAVKTVIEPIFEADMLECSFVWGLLLFLGVSADLPAHGLPTAGEAGHRRPSLGGDAAAGPPPAGIFAPPTFRDSIHDVAGETAGDGAGRSLRSQRLVDGKPARRGADDRQVDLGEENPRGCRGCLFMRRRGLEPPRGNPPTRPSTLRVYQFRHRRRGSRSIGA